MPTTSLTSPMVALRLRACSYCLKATRHRIYDPLTQLRKHLRLLPLALLLSSLLSVSVRFGRIPGCFCKEGREEDGELIRHKTGRCYYFCNLCSAGYNNSEAAWSHLKSAYEIVKPEEASKRATAAANSPLKRSLAATTLGIAAQKERVAQATMGDVINQEHFNEILVWLIVMRNLPISAVERVGRFA